MIRASLVGEEKFKRIEVAANDAVLHLGHLSCICAVQMFAVARVSVQYIQYGAISLSRRRSEDASSVFAEIIKTGGT